MKGIEFSYYSLYLKLYLQDEGDERADDENFINERSEAAVADFERSRRYGMSVHDSQEVAMKTLMEGFLDDQQP